MRSHWYIEPREDKKGEKRDSDEKEERRQIRGRERRVIIQYIQSQIRCQILRDSDPQQTRERRWGKMVRKKIGGM